MDELDKSRRKLEALNEELRRTQSDLAQERAGRMLSQLALKLFIAFQRTTEDVTEEQEFFERTLDLATGVLKFDHSAILTLEPATGCYLAQYVRGEIGLSIGQEIRREHVALFDAPAPSKIEVIEPVPEERLEPNSLAGTESRAVVPIFFGQEVVALLVARLARGQQTNEAVQLLGIFGDAISTAYRTCRMRSEMHRQLTVLDARARRLDLLGRVAGSLTKRLDMDALLSELLGLCIEAFDVTHCAVLLLDPNEENVLIRRASVGYDEVHAPVKLAKGYGITGHVAATGVPVLAPDVTKDPRYVPGIHGGRAEMAVPLRVFGQLIGVFDVESDQVGAFDEEDMDVFSSFAASVAVAIHNTELVSRMEAEAGRLEQS